MYLYGDRKLVCLRFLSYLWKGAPSSEENVFAVSSVVWAGGGVGACMQETKATVRGLFK